MKYLKLTLLFFGLMVFTFSSCKKKDKATKPDSNIEFKGSDDEFIDAAVDNLNLHADATKEFERVLQETGNGFDALFATAEWLAEKEEVEKIELYNTAMLIHHSNGIKTSISANPLDENGKSIFRGGGGGSELTEYSFARKNNPETFQMGDKVLIFNPYADQFYNNDYPFLDKFSDGAAQVDVTILTNEEANLASLETFKDYSFIILNTHGLPWGFKVREAQHIQPYKPEEAPIMTRGLVMEFYGVAVQPAKAGNVIFESYIEHVTLDGEPVTIVYPMVIPTLEYIRTLGLDNAVVFGNYCYSGSIKSPVKTDRNINMVEAWKAGGAATYYGYAFDDGVSMPVTESFAKAMEEALLNRFIQDGDSTGVAHLNSENKEYFDTTDFSQHGGAYSESYTEANIKETYSRKIVFEGVYGTTLHGPFKFKQFDEKRYKYGCGNFTDPRDEQTYKLACIGDQVWFAENLRYLGAGIDYDHNPANRAVNGRLYSMQEAMNGKNSNDGDPVQGACPVGWHIPSQSEIETLIAAAGEDYEKSLFAVGGWEGQRTNSTGFNLVPSGGARVDKDNYRFEGKGVGASFWTSTSVSGGGEEAGYIAFAANNRVIDPDSRYTEGPMHRGLWRKSVRCVQDD